MHRTTVIEPSSANSPALRRSECNNYVDLARRMNIPADDAIRQFIETWVTKLRLTPNQ
jgi:hypothetical protein